MNYPQHGGPPHGQHPQQRHVQPHSPPPAREKQRRRWPWVFLGVPIGMLVMLALISIGNGPTPASSGSTSGPAASGGISAATADVPEATPPAPSGPLATFGPGTWEVGVDIQSGKYKTTGPDGPNCYYARLKTGDGSVGDILDNNNSQGPVTVTIKESDGYFETQGCADWMKVDR